MIKIDQGKEGPIFFKRSSYKNREYFVDFFLSVAFIPTPGLVPVIQR